MHHFHNNINTAYKASNITFKHILSARSPFAAQGPICQVK